MDNLWQTNGFCRFSFQPIHCNVVAIQSSSAPQDRGLFLQCQPWINKPLGPRLFNWVDIIWVLDYDYFGSTPRWIPMVY